MEQSKEEILFDKFHYQICNDCGLSESDSTEIAAKNCVIIAQQEIEAKDRENEEVKSKLYLQIGSLTEINHQQEKEIERLKGLIEKEVKQRRYHYLWENNIHAVNNNSALQEDLEQAWKQFKQQNNIV